MSKWVLPNNSYNAIRASNSSASKDVEFQIQKIVSLSVMKEIRRLYRHSPLLEQIRSLLQKSVWSAGMGFFRENLEKGEGKFSKRGHRVAWKPPSFVRETVERHWVKFKHDVLDSLLMYGFVVVHYQLPQSAGEPIVDEREKKYPFPTVVPAELYRLMVSTSLTGGTKLVALHQRHQEELPDTVVYCDYGFNPTTDGEITSLVSKAYPDVLFLQEHARAQMRIKSIRCNPTVIIESAPEVKDEVSGSKTAARRAFVGNMEDSYGIAPADNVNATSVLEGAVPFSLNVNAREMVKNDNLLLRRARKELAYRRGDVRGAAMVDIPEDSMGGDRRVNTASGITLQQGETAKFMPIPSESNDFMHIRQTINESVAGVFGVPLGVLMGNALSGHGRGSVGESTARVVHSMYRLTVNEWRSKVSDVLTKAFGECYFELMVDSKLPETSSATLDTYNEKRRRMIHVDFNPTTFIDNQELRELYCWGILDFDTFSRYAMSNASLPIEERVKHPPPHPLGVGIEQKDTSSSGNSSSAAANKEKKKKKDTPKPNDQTQQQKKKKKDTTSTDRKQQKRKTKTMPGKRKLSPEEERKGQTPENSKKTKTS